MSLRYLAYRSTRFPAGTVGILSPSAQTVAPVRFPLSQSVMDMYGLIKSWDEASRSLVLGTPSEPISAIKIMAPLASRDILAVGKSCKTHAKESQLSVFHSNDKNKRPDLPVVFARKASSITSAGAKISLHPRVTESVDYECELGIIIGKGGLDIKKEDAWKHIWGAVIISNITTKRSGKDYTGANVGESLDSFCSMGPYAVHASALDWSNLVLENKLNGEVKRRYNLTFDIPSLVEACSHGITLQPGDVIATGTPASVGFGLNLPVLLRSGDKLEVSITGLGALTNVVGSQSTPLLIYSPARQQKQEEKTIHYLDLGLRQLGSGLKLHVEVQGKDSGNAPTIIFVHGLGGSSTNYSAMIDASGVYKTHRIITFDLEGFGLSPLSTSRSPTIERFADSIGEVLDSVHVRQAAVVGHSLGGLITSTFAAKYPDRVSKLLLIGPTRALTGAVVDTIAARAKAVDQGGLSAVVDGIVQVGVSKKTHASRPLSKAAVRATLLSSPPEGYVQACLALLKAPEPDYSAIKVPVLILVGVEDKTCPKATVDFLRARLKRSQVIEMAGVAHWNQLEDWEGSARVLSRFAEDNGNEVDVL